MEVMLKDKGSTKEIAQAIGCSSERFRECSSGDRFNSWTQRWSTSVSKTRTMRRTTAQRSTKAREPD